MRRGERWLIRHVDLSVPRGELVYLIGANGAGKSTCAKAILGLIDIDEGTIERSSELSVGYVPQRLAVSHTLPLTVRRLMKLTGRFPAPDIDAALTAVGLERLGDPPVTSLSGGELQRLLIARALIHRPDLLVLDEPAQGVDVAGAGVLHDLIDGIRRDLGCGVLLISHDLQMVMDTDNDVIVLVPHEHDESPLGPRSPHRLRARAAVRRFASSPEQMAIAAALAGVIAIAGGLFASARLDTLSGPSIVVAALLLFTVTRLRLLKGSRTAR